MSQHESKPDFDAPSEQEAYILAHPEFIVTRVLWRSDPFEVVEHLAAPADDAKAADPTLTDALARGRNAAFERGGVVEVWQRVGCYKAEAKQWC